LYGTGKTPVSEYLTSIKDSAALRENCLVNALDCSDKTSYCLRNWNKTKTYSISFYDSRSGKKYSDLSTTYNTGEVSTITPTQPEEDGYVFQGWCSEGELSLVPESELKTCANPVKAIKLSAQSSGNYMYYAIWTKAED
jgi:uncharacterized repeat protein (TIGR02543 family)